MTLTVPPKNILQKVFILVPANCLMPSERLSVWRLDSSGWLFKQFYQNTVSLAILPESNRRLLLKPLYPDEPYSEADLEFKVGLFVCDLNYTNTERRYRPHHNVGFLARDKNEAKAFAYSYCVAKHPNSKRRDWRVDDLHRYAPVKETIDIRIRRAQIVDHVRIIGLDTPWPVRHKLQLDHGADNLD